MWLLGKVEAIVPRWDYSCACVGWGQCGCPTENLLSQVCNALLFTTLTSERTGSQNFPKVDTFPHLWLKTIFLIAYIHTVFCPALKEYNVHGETNDARKKMFSRICLVKCLIHVRSTEEVGLGCEEFWPLNHNEENRICSSILTIHLVDSFSVVSQQHTYHRYMYSLSQSKQKDRCYVNKLDLH